MKLSLARSILYLQGETIRCESDLIVYPLIEAELFKIYEF